MTFSIQCTSLSFKDVNWIAEVAFMSSQRPTQRIASCQRNVLSEVMCHLLCNIHCNGHLDIKWSNFIRNITDGYCQLLSLYLCCIANESRIIYFRDHLKDIPFRDVPYKFPIGANCKHIHHLYVHKGQLSTSASLLRALSISCTDDTFKNPCCVWSCPFGHGDIYQTLAMEFVKLRVPNNSQPQCVECAKPPS